jgi:hypothetical protein
VAPDAPASDLTLRKVQELLNDPDAASKLEQETGMSREAMEQFVQKYQKSKTPGAVGRTGQEIQVKPGANRAAAPDPTLPGFNPNTNVSTKILRDRGAVVQDQVRDNAEGIRFIAPPEIRSGFEAYKSTLSRSRTLNPSRTPSAPAPSGGAGSR